jgi:hypothetical protein
MKHSGTAAATCHAGRRRSPGNWLVDVMAEELCWIDQVEQSQMPDDQRAIHKHHTWYLVEGTRPVG